MSRRTASSVVAAVVLVGLLAAAAFMSVPYVTMSPGPTVDLFARSNGHDLVQVEGHKTYPTDGELRLTTVSITSPSRRIGLLEALSAWFDGTRAVYPRDVVYPPDQSVEDVERESSVEMVSSQDTAIAVALKELGYKLPLRPEVFAVTKDSPAEGKLQPRDVIVSVNGTKVRGDVHQVSDLVQERGTDRPTEFVVRREGGLRTVRVQAEPSTDEPDRAVVGVQIGTGYDFPFDVNLRIDEKIGGPSAGLVFSLAVYDTLTPGSLVDGDEIAGTGTVDPAGKVGAIGGIQQKIVAAADAGADLFLVPKDNCNEAKGADVKPDEIRLVRADTMHQAVQSLETYADDPDATLPSCE